MALFRSDASSDMARSAPVDPAEQHNIIGASTTVQGTLRSDGNVRISGTVEGNVEVKGRTMVTPGGVVDGEVVSTSAEVAGTIRGQVAVRERLVLKASAVVEGDIRAGKLVVEDGATFNGQCRMGEGAFDGKASGGNHSGGAAVVGSVGKGAKVPRVEGAA